MGVGQEKWRAGGRRERRQLKMFEKCLILGDNLKAKNLEPIERDVTKITSANGKLQEKTVSAVAGEKGESRNSKRKL